MLWWVIEDEVVEYFVYCAVVEVAGIVIVLVMFGIILIFMLAWVYASSFFIFWLNMKGLLFLRCIIIWFVTVCCIRSLLIDFCGVNVF